MTIECSCEYDSGVIMTVDPECPIHKPGGLHPAIVPNEYRGDTPPPRAKGERGGGRIISENMQPGETDPVTELYADRLTAHHKATVFALNKRVRAVRMMDNVGWQRTAFIIEFSDGSALRLSGMELNVRTYQFSPSNEQAREELEREQ